MEIDKNLRETSIKCMQIMEVISNEVDSLQCDSDIDFNIKKLLSEQIETTIADVLITIDTLYEVELALEEGTELSSVYTIAFEDFNEYENE